MAGTIFMTVAITIERYLGLCHPLLNPHSRKAWFYVVPVLFTATLLNVPKFLVRHHFLINSVFVSYQKFEHVFQEINLEFGNYNETRVGNETIRVLYEGTENQPFVHPSDLRKSPDYIRAYIMWTRLFSTAVIPVILLFTLNIRIIFDVITSAKKVQRYEIMQLKK